MKKNEKNITIAFAGANTGKGFVSFYDSIFPEDKLDELYIIKGGPGTGKSTFMRKLSDIAVKKGYTAEHYLCGSDAESLDGIIINGKNGNRIGIIDGTPPHPREFHSPGAAGDVLNFGMFWDSKNLRRIRHEIDSLVREKQVCFDTAYRYLGAASKMDTHIKNIRKAAYLKEKGRAAARRLVDAIGSVGNCSYKELKGFTMNGAVSLNPCKTDTCEFLITGDKDAAGMFLGDVEAITGEKGVSAQISLSPLDMKTVDSIYFPHTKIWLHTADKDEIQPEKIINMQRFTDKKIISELRQKLRFGKKCRDALIEGAVEALSEARKYHFSLEELYKEHMDFDALEKQSSLWYSEILSRLD